jgi:hypothetical protein
MGPLCSHPSLDPVGYLSTAPKCADVRPEVCGGALWEPMPAARGFFARLTRDV